MKVYEKKISQGKKYLWDISFYDALQYMIGYDVRFMCTFLKVLRDFDSRTYFFECVPITSSDMKLKNFEFVLIPVTIPSKNDPQPFREHLSNDCSVVSFPSKHKTTILIVPCPVDKNKNYSSLGPYIRQNMIEQYLELFRKTASEMLVLLRSGRNPIWLNTHGLGVGWLHIRLDTIPKYYHHEPYKIHK